MGTKSLLGLFAVLSVFTLSGLGGDAEEPKGVTLLGTLEEWQYPGAKFGGATMFDGGNHQVAATNCEALLTTDDSVEQVVRFYTQKFVPGPADGRSPLKPGEIAQAVGVQTDSENRPVELRVITVNRARSSTTLVVSRSQGEQKTHIAWSHFQLLDLPR
ncbi:MAG: hypothetical protein JNG90_16940 [Planctomycetaceae bacterium]|nr:hypothetical protein [Planctomycetaceae bacterium]